MKGRSMFDPGVLSQDLADVRKRLAYVRSVASGLAVYDGPWGSLPSLRSLEKLEQELIARISLCTFNKQEVA